MQRIDHTKCNHEATPKARKACRKLTRAAVAVMQEEKARVALEPLSDEAMGLLMEQAEPFAKRAIVVSIALKNGQHCRVVFDRHGMNSELYRTALAYRWSAERTIAQACSEALASVLKLHGANSIKSHSVHEVD